MLSETGQMEMLPQTVESNLSLKPFTREGHQTPSVSSLILYCTTLNNKKKIKTTSLFVLCSVKLCLLCCACLTLTLTFRSGMENLQHEPRWVLVMVRFSFSTLVKLVLSSGTEINQKSVMMTPRASHRGHQS